MPRKRTEDDRQRAADRWSAWLRETAQRQGKRQIDLIKESGGVLSSATLSQWWDGKYSARPELAILVADLLGASEIAALRAAGHETLAQRMERRGRQGSAATARRFGAWLRGRARERELTPEDFLDITAPEKPFTAETLEGWWIGQQLPDPVNAALLGLILNPDDPRGPIDALRAAGYDDLADTAEALRRFQDPHVRRAARLVHDPKARDQIIAEYERRIEDGRRDAAEVLELKAQAAARNGGN